MSLEKQVSLACANPTMNKNQKNNTNKTRCYVFSEKTLDVAIQEWLDIEIKKLPEKEEEFNITVAALPWFLRHLTHTESVMMFTHTELVDELEDWKSRQVEAYPHQQDRIEVSCAWIIHFFESEVVAEHKMVIQT